MRTPFIIIFSILFIFLGCANQKMQPQTLHKITSNKNGEGITFDIHFLKGKHHNHPSFAIWIEDIEGNYIETLFVTQYVGTGIFGYQYSGDGKWENKSGPSEHPATLPYWLHKKGLLGNSYLPSPETPMPDAITGATPKTDFELTAKATDSLPDKFRLMLEINQTWDWNEYWNNSLHIDDKYYKTSCQPALIYSVEIDQSKTQEKYYLNPIGHSHYSGKDGNLYTDLSTLTTAKEIINKVAVQLKK